MVQAASHSSGSARFEVVVPHSKCAASLGVSPKHQEINLYKHAQGEESPGRKKLQ